MLRGDAINLLCFGFFGWSLITLVFGFVGMRDGSRRVTDSSRIVFRKRMSERISAVMFGILMVVGPLLQYGQGVIIAVLRHHPVPDWAYLSLLFGVLIAGGFGTLSVYLAGPRDLFLDLDRRTYRFVSWGPHSPRVQEGSWEDMAGIYVRSRSAKGTAGYGYIVEIAWRQERRMNPMLGSFHREDDAYALAEEMSALLGLPRVVPPPVGKTSVNPDKALLRKETPKPPFRPFRPVLFTQSAVIELTTDTEQPPVSDITA